MFDDLGRLRDSIRDVILTSDVDMGMIRLTLPFIPTVLILFDSLRWYRSSIHKIVESTRSQRLRRSE